MSLNGQNKLKDSLETSNKALNENLIAVQKVELYMHSVASIRSSFAALGPFLTKLKKCDAQKCEYTDHHRNR